MKPVVISWGFSQYDGKPYLDCYIDVDHNSENVGAVKMMELRGSSQGTKLALLKIPKEAGREYVEDYISHGGDEVIKLLKSAFVRSSEITRTRHENSAIDFITCKS